MEAESLSYIAARRRVVRQLVESMIHEGVLDANNIQDSALKPSETGVERGWSLYGESRDGKPVVYRFQGYYAYGFGRLRILTPVVRSEQGSGEEEVLSVAMLLEELLPKDVLQAEGARLAHFVKELEHTILNDSIHPKPSGEFVEGRTLPELEALTSTGHPYHPSYKSRLGFTLQDHKLYAPEFAPNVHLVWVAVLKAYAETHTLSSLSYDGLIGEVLGAEQKQAFESKLSAEGRKPQEYVLLPVHPWQWQNTLVYSTGSLQSQGILVALGPGPEAYQPLQSIRTLANVSSSAKPNIKLSMQLMNTSALRVIGSHHIRNASVISEWLHQLWSHDDYLRDRCQVIILREIAGAALAYDALPEPHGQLLSGSMSAVFRESVEAMLIPGEEAAPYTIVTYLSGASGDAAIRPWVEEYGLEKWTRRLLEVTLQPMLHLLYRYGIGLEAHGQNMVLIHRNGWPERIALRDLPGGTRAARKTELFPARPELPPLARKSGEEQHPILTERTEDVRDYWMDALLHIQLYEVSVFLKERFQLPEEQFWFYAAQEVLDYQQRYPEQEPAYQLLDLGAPNIAVGQLTARKLWGDGPEREHIVPNPLSVWIRERKEVGPDHGSVVGSSQEVGRGTAAASR